MLSIGTLGMPMVGFLFASADKVILLVLGEQWLGAVPIFKLLMPAAFNATIGIGLGWAWQSWGHVGCQLRWGIVSSAFNVILFTIGVRWGALGVAATYGLSRPFFLIAGFVYCFQGTPLKVTELTTTLSKPALASMGAALGLIGIEHLLPSEINQIVSLYHFAIIHERLDRFGIMLKEKGKGISHEDFPLPHFPSRISTTTKENWYYL